MIPGFHTVNNILGSFQSALKVLYGKEEILNMVYILMEEFLGLDRVSVHLNPDREVGISLQSRFAESLARLSEGCPVQYITGKTWFHGLEIAVNPSVLIPRPETEELVLLVRDSLRRTDVACMHVADIGTGSGCIPVYLKKEFAGLSVFATDISSEALATAEINAKKHSTAIAFLRHDILNDKQWPGPAPLHMIISNPPYVRESEKKDMRRNVTAYEPSLALYVSDQDPLLYYRAIADFGRVYLADRGMLWFEINQAMGDAMSKMLSGQGFQNVRITKDFRGNDRFVSAVFRS